MKNFLIIWLIVMAYLLFFHKKNNESPKPSHPTAREGLAEKVKIISISGENVNLKAHIVRGGITVFDFYADWCGPCRNLAQQLDPYINNTPGVYLRKINIRKWGSPVAESYKIQGVPSVWIYDANGNETLTHLCDFESIRSEIERLR